MQKVKGECPVEPRQRLLKESDGEKCLSTSAPAFDLVEHVDGRVGEVDAGLKPEPCPFEQWDRGAGGQTNPHVGVDAQILRLLGSVEPGEEFDALERRSTVLGGTRSCRGQRFGGTGRGLRADNRRQRSRRHRDEDQPAATIGQNGTPEHGRSDGQTVQGVHLGHAAWR
jgi:hypothetical protein